METPFVEIHCVRCGVYLPTLKELADLRARMLNQGFQCYFCNREVRVFQNGRQVTSTMHGVDDVHPEV